MAASNEPQADSITPKDHDRVLHLISLAYEGAFDAAERDLIDWSLIGAPLAEALRILLDEVAA